MVNTPILLVRKVLDKVSSVVKNGTLRLDPRSPAAY